MGRADHRTNEPAFLHARRIRRDEFDEQFREVGIAKPDL